MEPEQIITVHQENPRATFSIVSFINSKKRFIGGFLSILVLAGAIGAGVYLTQVRQSTRTRAGGVALSLSTNNSSPKVGDSITLAVAMDTAGQSVNAIDLKVKYDANVLSAQSVSPGTLLPTLLSPGSVAESGVATISMAGAITNSNFSSQNGSGLIASIIFKVISKGSTSVTIDPATIVGVAGQRTNAIGTTTPVQLTITGPAAPAPVTTNTGAVTAYNPYAVWIIGTNFTNGMKVRLIDTNGVQWGSDMVVSDPAPYQTTQQSTTFQLVSNSPPSGCNIGKSDCKIGEYLINSDGVLSNRLDLQLPAATGTPAPTAIPSPSPTPSASAPLINSSAIVTQYSPWASWILGKNFTNGMKIRLIDTTGVQWGSDMPASDAAVYSPDPSFQYVTYSVTVGTSPPSKCNIGNDKCVIGLYLIGADGSVSNKFDLPLPQQ